MGLESSFDDCFAYRLNTRLFWRSDSRIGRVVAVPWGRSYKTQAESKDITASQCYDSSIVAALGCKVLPVAIPSRLHQWSASTVCERGASSRERDSRCLIPSPMPPVSCFQQVRTMSPLLIISSAAIFTSSTLAFVPHMLLILASSFINLISQARVDETTIRIAYSSLSRIVTSIALLVPF
jgi:hypothetical protein